MTSPQPAAERVSRLWDSSDPETFRFDVAELNDRLSKATAQDVVEWAISSFGNGLVLTTSFGIQSAVMLHLSGALTDTSPLAIAA